MGNEGPSDTSHLNTGGNRPDMPSRKKENKTVDLPYYYIARDKKGFSGRIPSSEGNSIDGTSSQDDNSHKEPWISVSVKGKSKEILKRQIAGYINNMKVLKFKFKG